MRVLLPLSFAIAMLPAVPAQACVVAAAERALIHSALPALPPPDTIVAEVEILSSDEAGLYGQGVPARVVRVVQGRPPGNILILRWISPSSCDRPFANGRRGYVIAVDRGGRGLEPLVEPYPAIRGAGFRMGEGEKIPDAWRRTPSEW